LSVGLRPDSFTELTALPHTLAAFRERGTPGKELERGEREAGIDGREERRKGSEGK